MKSRDKLQKQLNQIITSNTPLYFCLADIVVNYCALESLLIEREYGKKFKFFRNCVCNYFTRFIAVSTDFDNIFACPYLWPITFPLSPFVVLATSTFKTLTFNKNNFNFTEMVEDLEKLYSLDEADFFFFVRDAWKYYEDIDHFFSYPSENTDRLKNHLIYSEPPASKKEKIDSIKSYLKNPTNTNSILHGIFLRKLRELQIEKPADEHLATSTTLPGRTST